jgi:hypothetical protein
MDRVGAELALAMLRRPGGGGCEEGGEEEEEERKEGVTGSIHCGMIHQK